MCAGTPDKFFERGVYWHWLLVRPSRGHHFKAVGNSNDASREAYVFASESSRVPAPVPLFVVLSNGVGPFSEPADKRLNSALTF
jgi:hypothetical protein